MIEEIWNIEEVITGALFVMSKSSSSLFFFYLNFKIMKGGLQLMRMSVGGCTLEVRGFERINLSLS